MVIVLLTQSAAMVAPVHSGRNGRSAIAQHHSVSRSSLVCSTSIGINGYSVSSSDISDSSALSLAAVNDARGALIVVSTRLRRSFDVGARAVVVSPAHQHASRVCSVVADYAELRCIHAWSCLLALSHWGSFSASFAWLIMMFSSEGGSNVRLSSEGGAFFASGVLLHTHVLVDILSPRQALPISKPLLVDISSPRQALPISEPLLVDISSPHQASPISKSLLVDVSWSLTLAPVDGQISSCVSHLAPVDGRIASCVLPLAPVDGRTASCVSLLAPTDKRTAVAFASAWRITPSPSGLPFEVLVRCFCDSFASLRGGRGNGSGHEHYSGKLERTGAAVAADREAHSTCAPVSAVHDGCALGRCTCICTPAVMAPDGNVTGNDQDSAGKAESTVSNGEAHSMCVLSSATLDGGAPAVVTLDGSALSTCLLALAAAFDGALRTYLTLVSDFDFSTFLASYYFPLAACMVYTLCSIFFAVQRYQSWQYSHISSAGGTHQGNAASIAAVFPACAMLDTTPDPCTPRTAPILDDVTMAVCGWPSVDDTSDESSDDGDDEWLDVYGNTLTGAEASTFVLAQVTYDGCQWLWLNGSALTPEEVLYLASVLGMERILPAGICTPAE